jgi:hypothetical protein
MTFLAGKATRISSSAAASQQSGEKVEKASALFSPISRNVSIVQEFVSSV